MIYFITDGKYVKIGYTDQDDVESRLRVLQTGNARKLTLIGCIEGSFPEEKLLHSILENLRVRGEWFLLSPENRDKPENKSKNENINKEEMTEAQLKVYEEMKRNPRLTDTAIAENAGVSRQTVWTTKKKIAEYYDESLSQETKNY